jgi:hypothetical protein
MTGLRLLPSTVENLMVISIHESVWLALERFLPEEDRDPTTQWQRVSAGLCTFAS